MDDNVLVPLPPYVCVRNLPAEAAVCEPCLSSSL